MVRCAISGLYILETLDLGGRSRSSSAVPITLMYTIVSKPSGVKGDSF